MKHYFTLLRHELRVLIITPPDPLGESAMATIQAALARGIEQTFQIESSELAVEALPARTDRRSLLLYEAAEGGAGVLNQLATDPNHLARAARSALSLMHYLVPDGFIDVDRLSEPDPDETGGGFTCEAGCYQCLLSYFNQPDHEIIDRRERDALQFLANLANGQVTGSADLPHGNEEGSLVGSTLLSQWLSAIAALGLRKPDQTRVPVNGGTSSADAYYQSARTLVFLSEPDESVMAYASDRGYTVICFPPNPEAWTASFAEYPQLFGS